MQDHPLALGRTSAIERGPWHYGADYVTVFFRGDPLRMSSLVPKPFEVSNGEGIAYVCEIVSVSDSDPDMVAREPDRTLYQEAAVGVGCSYGGKRGVFYPIMWVSTEWALLRGLANGYQKRLADKIAMTKLHSLNSGLKPMGHGTSMSGFCVKGGESRLRVEVTLDRPGLPGDLPSFGSTFGLRLFPSTHESQGSVEEPVEILKSGQKSSDIWLGEGRLKSDFDLGETEVRLGAAYRSGFTIEGAKALTADKAFNT